VAFQWLDRKIEALNIFQTWDHIYPLLQNRRPRGYEWGQIIEMQWKIIKMLWIGFTDAGRYKYGLVVF
jgi:hypothetical protein